MDKFTKEFRWLVERSGWRQSRIADELALSRGTVTDYMSGRTKPSLTVLRLFSRLINQPLDLPNEAIPTALEGRVLEEWESSLFASIRKANPSKRKAIAQAAQTLIEALETEHVVNKSPLKEGGDVGKGKDAVMEKLQRQAAEVVDTWITERQPGAARRRRTQNESPS